MHILMRENKILCYVQFEIRKQPIILPIQLRRKQATSSKMPQYTVISEKLDRGGSGDATVVSKFFSLFMKKV